MIISSPPKVAWSVSGVKVSAGGPKATTRPLTKQSRSLASAAPSRSWVAWRMVAPSSRSSRINRGDGLLGRAVDAGHRLVQEQDRCLLHQGAGEEDALLLPARERADLSIAEGRHADALERRRHRPVVGGARRRATRPMRG